jgi:hypothetical protein
VGLVNFNTKIVLDPLYGKILPETAELVVDVLKLGLFLLPLTFQHLERLLQHWLGPYIGGVGRTGQSVVDFFNYGAGAFNGEVFCHFVQVHAICFLLKHVAGQAVRCDTVKQFGFYFGFQRLLHLKLFKSLQSLYHFEICGRLLL